MTNKIDIQKAKEYFEEYVKNYDYKDEQVKMKIAHIGRVANIARKLAISLELSEEDVELAELIGLLHDIGRFEQIKRYHTFLDKKSINHGEYGVKILFEDGLIRKFIEKSEYDEIIKKAIINHNRMYIEEGLSERELLHAKLIRDADKTDIYFVLQTAEKKTVWETDDLSNELISDEIYREYMENRRIEYANMKTCADILVADFAYVYDFYFKPSITIIKENHYLDTLYKRFKFNNENTREKFDTIYQEAKKYVEEKG